MSHVGENALRQVEQARQKVVVLTGPAGCGKTACVLEFYRSRCDQAGRSACLLIAPNRPAADGLKRRLLATSPGGVVIAPKVLTFAALAGRIMSAGGHPTHLLPAFGRRLLLRHIISELCAAGELPVLAKVADTPGIVTNVDRAIAELKRAAVDPESLEKAIEPSARGASGDLWKIYRLYQRHMQERQAYDVDGQLWQARDCLLQAGDGPPAAIGLEGISAIAADGFTDFTPTQLQILSVLSARMDKTLITLPVASDGRKRLWHWTNRTLGNIRATFKTGLAQVELPAGGGPLDNVWRGVFDPDAPAAEAPAKLHLVSAAGVEAEVASAARKIKRMLVDDPGCGSIGVLARSLESYWPIIERIFPEHGIPISPQPTGLAQSPIVRFAIDVASLAPDFAFGPVLRVIRNSYFRPGMLGSFDESALAVAEMIIRRGNVLAGREAYHEAALRLRRVRAAASPEDETEDGMIDLGVLRVTPEQIDQADAMLQKLFDLSQGQDRAAWLAMSLPNGSGPERSRRAVGHDHVYGEGPACGPATLSAAERLLELVRRLGLYQAALDLGEPKLIARDLRALAAMEECLKSLRDGGSEFTLDDIREAMSAASSPPARGEGLVEVLGVLDARAIRFRHVFLLGVSEGLFPRRFSDTSILSEQDRSAYARRGLALDSRGDLLAREMLLFYLAASRADESLCVSFLQSDASGQPSAPSNFLLSMIEPLGGLKSLHQARRVEVIPLGQFVPAPAEIASPTDAFNSALAGLFDRRCDGAPAALAWAKKHAPAKIASAARGLFARYRRYLPGPCDTFDGRITDKRLLERLADRFSGGGQCPAVFSASSLNTFGQCPWHFFGLYVLNLAPLTEPQRQLQAVEAGTFCHNVMFRLAQGLGSTFGRPFELGKIEQEDLLKALDDAVAAEASQVQARRLPYPLLWQLQLQQLTRDLRQYVLEARLQGLAAQTLHAELSFGMRRRDSQPADGASTASPVEISTPAGNILLRGKIDRVDRVTMQGSSGLLVVDYKTGRLPSLKDIVEGRNLQLPLYSVAAERILGSPSLGGAFHKIGQGNRRQQYFASIRQYRGKYSPDEDFASKQNAAMDLVGRFVQKMRRGEFDLLPTCDCPGYCPLRQTCQFSPARQELKAPLQPAAEGEQ